MNLLSTSILSFIVTILKLLSALVINKVVAIYAGPSGLAIVAQLHNLIQLSGTIGQAALGSGITKYSADYKNSQSKLILLLSTAFKIAMLCSIILAFLVFYFSDFLAVFFLKTSYYSHIFEIFSLSLFFLVINNLILAFLNGIHEIKKWSVINIGQSIFAFVFVSLLAYSYELEGVLIAMVTYQIATFALLVLLLKRYRIVPWFKVVMGTIDSKSSRKLLSFAAVAATSAISLPIVEMIIRHHISVNYSLDHAGYWQSAWYISSLYLLVVTTTLSTYYLPRFSTLESGNKIKQELLKGLGIFMPLVILSAFIVYLVKDLVIVLLFTPEFSPAGDLLLWQLVGDVVKVAAWFFSFAMLAKARTKALIYSEIVFSIHLVFLSLLLINYYGVSGAPIAFALNYAVYFVFVLFYVSRNIFTLKTES